MSEAVRDLDGLLDDAFARRSEAGAALAGEAEAVARVCGAMAARFGAGGRLLTFGTGAAAADAAHVAVEFLHPVIVGKRALPARALTHDVATLTDVGARAGDELFAVSLRLAGAPGDIALGLSLDGRCASVARGLAVARGLGMLTVALTGGGADTPVARAAEHALVIPAHDRLAVREALVTAYHVVWELVHVFLQRSGPSAPVGTP